MTELAQTDAKPSVRKLGVAIITPLRQYRGPRDLPPQIGKALRDLVERQDESFRVEAEKYRFDFIAAVGGICRARNAAVHEALKSTGDDQIDFIVMWDADIWPDDPAWALLRLLSHRQPIVGALYCRRGSPPVYVTTWFQEAGFEPKSNGALQVIELGTGLKCFHRQVFTELRRLDKDLEYIDRTTGEKMTAYFQHGVIDHDELSEDYFLDMLCRKYGVGILADTKLKVWHVEDGMYYPEKGAWPPIPAVEADKLKSDANT